MLYIYECFQLVAFIREHMWHKEALLMGYLIRLEISLVSSLNDLWLVRQVYIGVILPLSQGVFYIYSYIYIYIYGVFNRFPDKIQHVIAIHLMIWLSNFYDFSFKWTTTAAIGKHPTKAWLSQLVKFKNAIWTWEHFRKTIYNKILF